MKQFNLEEYLKNPSRKVVTRSGDAVKIHCTDFNDDEYPIVARVEGISFSTSFTKDGKYDKFNSNSKYDLFFAPEKHEGWINVYRNREHLWCGDIKRTETEAKEFEDSEFYITSIKIEWEE